MKYLFDEDESIMTPKRIQRKRTKGWRMPPNTVCVTRPGKWGNPFSVEYHHPYWVVRGKNGIVHDEIADKERAIEIAVNLHKTYIEISIEFLPIHELRGKNLACWCKEGEPCHGDYLLEIANRKL